MMRAIVDQRGSSERRGHVGLAANRDVRLGGGATPGDSVVEARCEGEKIYVGSPEVLPLKLTDDARMARAPLAGFVSAS